MKIKSLACALIAFGAYGIANADTYSIAASGTVNGICKFTQAAGQTLVFSNNLGGGIDPSVATDASASTSVTYKCTKGTSPSATTAAGSNDTGGNHLLKDTASNSMIYTVALTPGGAGTGFGAGSSDKTLGVAGSILQTQFALATAGVYTDTLTVTIAP